MVGRIPDVRICALRRGGITIGTAIRDVQLIYPEDWDIIDKVSAFLMNKQMYDLCKTQDADFYELSYSTADELRALFESEMFVVAAVGNGE